MSLSETPNDAPPPSEEEIAETRKWLTSAADWRVERGELQSQVLSVFDRLVAERDRLAASVAVYAKYLGEVVAFGTDAAELDRQLCECLEERDALRAENASLKAEVERLKADGERLLSALSAAGDAYSSLCDRSHIGNDDHREIAALQAILDAIDLARKAQGGE